MSYHPESLIVQLEERARELRIDSLDMIYRRGAGHPGGSLSAAEIIAALFFHKMRLDPERPDWPERDRFILSKGHASAILYAALARRGFFPVEDLKQWGELSCHLQGHPDRLKTPGVEMTSGILGHGVAIGTGLALATRMNGFNYRVYVLLGDGECQGGIVWEGAMAAAKYRLANLTAIAPLPVPSSRTQLPALPSLDTVSTSISVSGLGIRTLWLTTKSSDINSLWPVR